MKFGSLDYGTVFQYDDVVYLKILDPIDGDVAVVLDDPYENTLGEYRLKNIDVETPVDKIYSASLHINCD
jgi:hypothetical protein